MATAKDFVDRIAKLEGVAGCLLIREDGMLLAQTIEDPENYSNLMITSAGLAVGIMETSGFSYCRHLSFIRKNKQHFYVFSIGKYLLGVEQCAEISAPGMLDAIYRLVGRVSTSTVGTHQDGS